MAETRGRFITLEGGEGVGKSTLAELLADLLRRRGHEVLLTREPGGTPGAESIRNLILYPPEGVYFWQPLVETLLFYAARSDHLDKKIRPHLQMGGWVICDRFSDSTRAYQSAAGGVLSDTIETLDRICVGPTVPDLTFILDLPIVDAASRIAQRAQLGDAIESRVISYHEAVREAFLEIAERNPQRCVVLDSASLLSEVLKSAIAAIDARLGDG